MSAFTGEEDWDCPLCMEEMDLSDKNFRPCPCGYQVCRFCWHKIREDGNQRCPACRKVYDETEAEFVPVPQEEMNRMRLRKRAVKEKREAAAQAEMDCSPAGVALTTEIVNSRKYLSEFRVIQRNLVYVIGIAAKIAHENVLKDTEFFGQFGKIIKIVVNKKNFLASTTVANAPSASAYITFARKDDAARAIEYVDGSVYDDRVIRATYGTTKYCSYFLRGLTCQNPGCMYLHEPGEEVSSFTKEQLSNGSHNLHSFIVDKNESANLRQFGTIMVTGPSAASTQHPVRHATSTSSATVPLTRSASDSPKPAASPVASPPATPVSSSTSSGPPGLHPPVDDKVPLIHEISTNSFFDRISRLVTASELEELASVTPRGLSFFAPRSPPPPALSPSLGFFSLASGTRDRLSASNSQSSRHASTDEVFRVDSLRSSVDALSHSSASSCPSRQSFSFSNLPIRSPKTPSPPAILESAAASPAPAKTIHVESLFPSDYRPAAAREDANTNGDSAPSSGEVPKKFTSGRRPETVSAKTVASAPVPVAAPTNNTVKITIAGRPIETTGSAASRKPASSVEPARSAPVSADVHSTAAPSFTNKNIFDLLQPADEPEPVAMPSSASTDDKTSRIGSVRVLSAYSMPPQTAADLERLAREEKLLAHISSLEETMFRNRLQADALEQKIKLLFEANVAAASVKRSNPVNKK